MNTYRGGAKAGLGWGGRWLRRLLALSVGGASCMVLTSVGAEPAWEKLGPGILKASEPVCLERNPLQQARQVVQPKPLSGRVKKDFIVKLRRHLEEQVRGVVRVNGRALLLLGGRVCQVGQELPFSAARVALGSSVAVRIKSIEGGRLVLLLSDPESEDAGCEEWVYPLSEFLYQS